MGLGNHFAAYLIQQAVEQIALALATTEGVHVPRARHHQLDWIVRQLPIENAAASKLAKTTWVEAFATTYRYPSPSGRLPALPDAKRLEEVLAIAGRSLDDISTYYEVDLRRDASSVASHARPFRAPRQRSEQ